MDAIGTWDDDLELAHDEALFIEHLVTDEEWARFMDAQHDEALAIQDFLALVDGFQPVLDDRAAAALIPDHPWGEPCRPPLTGAQVLATFRAIDRGEDPDEAV